MMNAPRPMGLDEVADLLAAAQHHTRADHGATRFHFGQCRAGTPFMVMVNTVDGMGFSLTTAPRLRLAAANESPAASVGK